jgi:hypothetical protein
MNQTLITSTLVWERGLEFEEERRRTQRQEPIANYLAPVQRLLPRERKPLLTRLFKSRQQPAPAVYTSNRECCPET